jgi:hypothetical protein
MTTQRVLLGAVSPFFIVKDVSDAVRFYCERLAFEVRFSEPADCPFFAIVGRDDTQIFLKAVSDVSAQPNHTRHPWVPWDAFVFVSDPDALATELTELAARAQAKEGSRDGKTFHREITDRDDGLRGFEIADVDGYVLFFGRPR